MTEQNIVEIDRIVLRGLDVAPHRAERIRALVEVELELQLMKGNIINGLEESDLSNIKAPHVRLAEPQRAGCLARQLARSITQVPKKRTRGGRCPSLRRCRNIFRSVSWLAPENAIVLHPQSAL